MLTLAFKSKLGFPKSQGEKAFQEGELDTAESSKLQTQENFQLNKTDG